LKSEEDLLAAAARIDQAVKDEGAAGTLDQVIATPPEASTPEKKRGRPSKYKKSHHKKTASGSTTGKTETPGETPAPAVDGGSLEGVISGLINNGLQLAKKKGWTSPGTELLPEADWCSLCSTLLDKLRVKYMGDNLGEYEDELTLAMLVAPWAIFNIGRMIDARVKSRRAVGRNGKRENDEAGGTPKREGPGNPGGPDDGQQSIPGLGDAGGFDGGSAGTDRAA